MSSETCSVILTATVTSFPFHSSGDYSNALLHYEKGVTKLPEVGFIQQKRVTGNTPLPFRSKLAEVNEFLAFKAQLNFK